MSYYLKTLLSEQERSRILSLHQDRRKSEFRGLIKEAIDQNVQKFFEDLKTTLPGFPKDGYIYEADIDGKRTTVWEVLDTANNLKYYLLQDGTAVDSNGQKSTNKWYTSLPRVTAGYEVTGTGATGTGATGTGATGTGATGTGATGTGATGTGAQGVPQKLMGGRELKDLEKQLKQQANQQRKAQKKLTKENVQKCRNTFDTYVKYFGDEQRKANLIKDPKGAESFKGYTSEIESCCPIFSKDKRYLPNVQKQGFCAVQTTNNQGADSDGNGIPDFLQVNPQGATGTGATGTGATGTGATGTQNRPGMGGSGMGRLSAEDQELRDLGLQ